MQDEEAKAEDEEDSQIFTQPALITGARLKKYQLEGVAWMAGLYKNGISGILGTPSSAFHSSQKLISTLADEMGLGKVRHPQAYLLQQLISR